VKLQIEILKNVLGSELGRDVLPRTRTVGRGTRCGAGATTLAISRSSLYYRRKERRSSALALVPSELTTKSWWGRLDSNQEPTDYESAALTIELQPRITTLRFDAVFLQHTVHLLHRGSSLCAIWQDVEGLGFLFTLSVVEFSPQASMQSKSISDEVTSDRAT
jgi:hypothetical protein